MKKTKIASIIFIGIALVLEILPFGVIMRWDSFYGSTTYHSYFDLKVFEYGDIGPFFCAILTAVAFGMMLASLFFKENKIYLLSVTAITFSSVILSLIPTFYEGYSIFGVIITVALSVATELNAMRLLNERK